MLIECQVCNKTLRAPIYMCESGHSICGDCTKEQASCNCESQFTLVRNNLAEILLLQVDSIKVRKYIFFSIVHIVLGRDNYCWRYNKFQEFIMGNGATAANSIDKINESIEVNGINLNEPAANKAEALVNKVEMEGNTNEPSVKAWEKFSCWIDKSCGFVGIYTDIIEHLKQSHPLQFEEASIV